MAFLLYGSGLRVLECCRLRVQDINFGGNQIVVRAAKGDKDRVTVLPTLIKHDLARCWALEARMRVSLDYPSGYPDQIHGGTLLANTVDPRAALH